MAGRLVYGLVGAFLLGFAGVWCLGMMRFTSADSAVDPAEHENDERMSRGGELAFTWGPALVIGYFGALALTYALTGSVPAWAARIGGAVLFLVVAGSSLFGALVMVALVRSNAVTEHDQAERKSLMDTGTESGPDEALQEAILGWMPPRVRMSLLAGVWTAGGLLFLLLAAEVLLTGPGSAAALLTQGTEIWGVLELVAVVIFLIALLAAAIDGDPLAALLAPLYLIGLGVAYVLGLLDGPIDILTEPFRD